MALASMLPLAAFHGWIPGIVVTILLFLAAAFIIMKLVRFFAVVIGLALIVLIAWWLGLFEMIGLGVLLPALGM